MAFRRAALLANELLFSFGDITKSKTFRRLLRKLMRLTFSAEKVSKNAPATSPPGFAGCPAVLDAGGAKRTRCAQTPFRLLPPVFPRFGGLQAH